MKACGVIVEYNPFHNGHEYHVKEARRLSEAECVIAVMSGQFLQRGEPAIIDKFHRTYAALKGGVDLVIELPYQYAVQSSENFAKGAVLSLNEIAVSSICFGSESGLIDDFINGYSHFKEKQTSYDKSLQKYLSEGYSFPKASHLSYDKIGLHKLDMFKPNNILGFSYVKAIFDYDTTIKPLTIKRINNEFHDKDVAEHIASATSIRESITKKGMTEQVIDTFPSETLKTLNKYKQKTNKWHSWEDYFPFLSYRIMTMSLDELKEINGVDEGLEYRLKRVITHARSFTDFMTRLKTKRYTWTRLQRMCVHILTNSKKEDYINKSKQIDYVRVLGMNTTGQEYLNKVKDDLNVPLISHLSKKQPLHIDERASHTYYSILDAETRQEMWAQELKGPVIVK